MWKSEEVSALHWFNWVVSLSIYATMFSSITFMSVPAMSFSGSMTCFAISFGIIIMVPITVKWYLPFFRKLNLTSAYEYLEFLGMVAYLIVAPIASGLRKNRITPRDKCTYNRLFRDLSHPCRLHLPHKLYIMHTL